MSTAISPVTAPASEDRALSTKGLFVGAALGAAASAVGNVILYLGSGALGVSRLGEFQPGTVSELPLVPVIMASIVPALPAVLLAAGLNRFLKKPAMVFTVVAALFALLSMGGPAALGGATTGMKVVLALMHVVSGVAIAGGILRQGAKASAH
jgi:hypothetical protein